MPQALFHRSVNLDYLNPDFLGKLLSLLADAQSHGYSYKVYSGYRSCDEQARLYKLYQGGGARAAPPGLSAHNYGLAIDCGRLVDGKVSWLDADLDPLAKLAEKHGLAWGGHFADKPHLQHPQYVTGQQLLPLKQIWDTSEGDDLARLKKVWANLK